MSIGFRPNPAAGFQRTYENCALKMKGGPKRGCRVLQSMVCSNPESCAFHKTAEEKRASKEAYNRRMKSLPDEAQQYYAEKYHMGNRPWQEGRAEDGEKE